MTIRNLEIFCEVCRSMNMSKAAQALLISQSSVSQAVAALEKEYQVPSLSASTILSISRTPGETFSFSPTRY